MVEEVAGENLVAPVPDLGQPALDLRESDRPSVGVRLEESGEGRGGAGVRGELRRAAVLLWHWPHREPLARAGRSAG